ncbi:hypothetical protein [Nostoc sp.]|uniref:hypothetical protein n=1 Tax=Nostoc sp. TaxID=1180 RepID=UPI002FF63E38
MQPYIKIPLGSIELSLKTEEESYFSKPYDYLLRFISISNLTVYRDQDREVLSCFELLLTLY